MKGLFWGARYLRNQTIPGQTYLLGCSRVGFDPGDDFRTGISGIPWSFGILDCGFWRENGQLESGVRVSEKM